MSHGAFDQRLHSDVSWHETDQEHRRHLGLATVNVGKTRELTVKNIPTTKLKTGTGYYFKWTICNVKGETNTGNNTARTTGKFKVNSSGILVANALLPDVSDTRVFDAVFEDYAPADIVDFSDF